MKRNLCSKFVGLTFIAGFVLYLFIPPVFAKDLKGRETEARAKYQVVRQQYLKEVNWWKNAREEFLNARANYRKAKNPENRAIYEEKAKTFLEKTIDVLIKRLESLKNWVANKPMFSESERNSIIEEIDEDINWLKEKKEEIHQALPAQIKEKAKEIRQYWRNHRVLIKKIIAQIWEIRLTKVIERFETVSLKISAKIEELKAAEKDVSQLEAWYSEFSKKVELAKEKRDKAREKYQAISSLTDANQLFREAHQFIKEGNQYLREAHKTLVDIVREIKRLIRS